MKLLALLLVCLAVSSCLVVVVQACQGHDQPCEGANGSQGNCCGGMHCQKNDPSWAQGRCYYNPGRK
ncbi:hypothetical protein RvY_16174 [Ramazzottius varieornatus]|uniref:Uncharacterized protein n=1 Tax=Ramazzottius varieornatus TaxID=947166 RepID=A0A1D1W0G9_RAMVA|nr:hypothetical protein RvY_16174 [Ramazzottius varieornatus]